MKLSVVLLFISFSFTSAIIGDITGPIKDFFEDDIGGGLADLGDWFSDTFDPVGGWFTGPVANFFEDAGNGIYFVLKETGNFFVSGYTAVRDFGGALFGGGGVIIPTWRCYDKTTENGVRFLTNVPIKTVKTMFDKDGDPDTPDEEITDIACLTDSSGDCDYGWCENPVNLADDAPSAMCTQKPLWSEARDPCVVLYLGEANDPPTTPCALQTIHPTKGVLVNTFEGTPCFDGNYANGDDECFQGQCVPSAQICRDDDDWKTDVVTPFGTFQAICDGFPVDSCDIELTPGDGLAADHCPVTCDTCGAQGKPFVDKSLRSLNEKAKPKRTYTYHVAGGVLLGAVIIFGLVTKFRRGRKAQVTVMETPEPTVF